MEDKNSKYSLSFLKPQNNESPTSLSSLRLRWPCQYESGYPKTTLG